MMRKIRYKEGSSSLEKLAAPNINTNNNSIRSSVGMDKFVGEYYYVDISKLIPFKNQARVIFDDEELDNLATSIKEHGIRQPLTIIRSPSSEDKFEVVSGERRLRAAQKCGLDKVPCIIMEDYPKAEEVALIENIQRQDLHPIELAEALKKLIDKRGWGGQSEIQHKLGIKVSTISELLKLTELPEKVKEEIIARNFRGRENFRKLLKLKKDDEQIDFIKGESSQSLKQSAKRQFSIIRLSFDGNQIKSQVSAIQKLTIEQKNMVKAEVEKILQLLI